MRFHSVACAAQVLRSTCMHNLPQPPPRHYLHVVAAHLQPMLLVDA
jgi:hypothetical protein